MNIVRLVLNPENRELKPVEFDHDSLVEESDVNDEDRSRTEGTCDRIKPVIKNTSLDNSEKKNRKYIKIDFDGESSSKSSKANRKRNYIEINTDTEDSSKVISEVNKTKRVSIESKEKNDDPENEPNFVGYQLVGDSQFCRFGQQILGLERVPTPNGKGRIGICVSGQTISELHQRVKDKFYPVKDKIILMIGTNDFLNNVDVSTMCQQLTALVKTLMKETTCIVILTLPPVPKLAYVPEHWSRLEKYNKHIQSLCNGDSVQLGDISHMYRHPKISKCQMHLFEVYFPGRQRRLDMIHLNNKGLEIIRNFILDNF